MDQIDANVSTRHIYHAGKQIEIDARFQSWLVNYRFPSRERARAFTREGGIPELLLTLRRAAELQTANRTFP
jgi:hypothetical protein